MTYPIRSRPSAWSLALLGSLATTLGCRDHRALAVRASTVARARVAADASGAAVDAPASDPVAYAGAFAARSGPQTARITVRGVGRTVWVYAPEHRGAHPPLIVAFHGTDLSGDEFLQDSGARAFAEANGVVVVAPGARHMGPEMADFNRPLGNAYYWETARDANPDTNPDLLLTRALLVEAHRAFDADLDRVYAFGFSNGGFMALHASVALRDRIAAFAESSAGLVTCDHREDCAFTGSSLACAALSRERGYCACAGPDKPEALPATGARPGFLWHAVEDSTVSVYYTCTLDARMTALGVAHRVQLWHGGHALVPAFLASAWPYVSTFTR